MRTYSFSKKNSVATLRRSGRFSLVAKKVRPIAEVRSNVSSVTTARRLRAAPESAMRGECSIGNRWASETSNDGAWCVCTLREEQCCPQLLRTTDRPGCGNRALQVCPSRGVCKKLRARCLSREIHALLKHLRTCLNFSAGIDAECSPDVQRTATSEPSGQGRA